MLMSQFLTRFDVIGGRVAEDALLSIFVTRSEVLDSLAFGGASHPIASVGRVWAYIWTDEFWTSLTPEKAFLGRVFAEHCASNKASSLGS